MLARLARESAGFTRAAQPFIAVAQNYAVVVIAQEFFAMLTSKTPKIVRP